MTELARKRCKPCEGGTARLTPEQIKTLLAEAPGWRLDEAGTGIGKVYPFHDYYQTMAFANAVAYIAHTEDHHPVMVLGYRQCEVRYTTHAISGLSENDFICAAKIDRLYAEASGAPPG